MHLFRFQRARKSRTEYLVLLRNESQDWSTRARVGEQESFRAFFLVDSWCGSFLGGSRLLSLCFGGAAWCSLPCPSLIHTIPLHPVTNECMHMFTYLQTQSFQHSINPSKFIKTSTTFFLGNNTKKSC